MPANMLFGVFFNTLRTELATYPGITVSNVCPGPVKSNIVKNALTEEVTKTLGSDADQSHKMATSRCARLMLIAMANDLKEVWIAEQPFCQWHIYGNIYQPGPGG